MDKNSLESQIQDLFSDLSDAAPPIEQPAAPPAAKPELETLELLPSDTLLAEPELEIPELLPSDAPPATAREQLLARAVESIADAVLITDRNSVIQFANPAAEKITGYSADELVGQTTNLFKSGAHPDSFYRDMWRAITAGQVWQGVLTNRRKDGDLYRAELTISPIIDDAGQVQQYVTIQRDVTTQQQSEAKYSALFNGIADPVFIFDAETLHFLDCNQAVLDRYGYTMDELYSMTPIDLHLPEEKKRGQASIQDTESTRNEYLYVTKEREYIPVEISSAEIEYGGRPAWISLIRDIGERKKIEAQRENLLKDVERRSQQLFTAAEVSRAVSSILDTEELGRELVALIRERFDFYYVGLFLVDEQHRNALLQAGTGPAGQAMLAAEHQLEIGGSSMIGQCIATREARIALDVGDEAARFDNPVLPDTRSEMALPLISRGLAIGALTVQSTEMSAFSDEDIAILQTMADQLANAIVNAQLFAQTQDAEERARALFETSHAIASQLEEIPLMHTILEAVYQTLDCQNVNISLVDEQAGMIRSEHSFSAEGFDAQPDWIAKAQYPLDHSDITPDVYRSGRTEIIGEWDERFNKDIWDQFGHDRLLRIFMPLKPKDKVIGIVEVAYDKSEKASIDDEDLQLLSAFMDQAAVFLDNMRLLEDTNRRADQLAVLNRIANAASTTIRPEELIDTVCPQIISFFQADAFFLALYDAHNNELDFRYVMEQGERISLDRYPLAGLAAFVIDEKKPLSIQDLESERDSLPEAVLVGSGDMAASWLGVPLLVGEKVIGIINVQSQQKLFWNDDDEQLLFTVADQIAVALENVRLFQERERQAAELAIVNEIGQAISSPTLEQETFLNTVHNQVGRLFDTTNFYIATYDAYDERDHTFTFALHIEHGERQAPARHPLSAGLTGQIINTREPILMQSLQDCHAIEEDRGFKIIGELPLSWLGVPLIVADRVVGVMAIQSYEHEHLYDDQDLALFSTVADQVAIALENLRLLDDTRNRAQQMEVINQVGQAAISVLDLDTILRDIVDTIKSRFGHYFVGITMVEENRLVFRSSSTIGDTDRRLDMVGVQVGGGASLIAEAVISRQPVLVNDATQDPRYLHIEELPDTRSELDIPIITKGRVIGVLDVQSDRPYAYTPSDVALLQLLSNTVGAAIDNAQLFSQTQQQLADLTTIQDTISVLNATATFEDAQNALLPMVIQTSQADSAILFLVEGENMVRAATYPIDEDSLSQLGQVLSLADYPLTRKVIQERKANATAADDPQLQAHDRETFKQSGITANATIPLIGRDNVIGILSVSHRQPNRVFAQQEILILQTLADQATTAFEKVRLLEQTRIRAAELAVLNDLGQALTAQLDLQQVMEQAYQGASRLLDTTNFYIGLYDKENELVNFAFDVSESEIDQEITSMPVSEGVTGYIIRHRTSLLVTENILERLEEMGIQQVGEPAKSWIGVPLIMGDQVLGAMGAQNYEKTSAWDRRDLDLLTAISNQTAIAIYNANLFEATQKALTNAEILAREQAVLAELGRALTARLDVDQVLQETYRQTSRLVDTTSFFIGLYDESQHEINFRFMVTDSEVDREIEIMSADKGFSGYIVRNRASLLLTDNVTERAREMGLDIVGDLFPQSWLGVPLAVGDRVLGAMGVESYHTAGLFGKREQDLLNAIASQVAIALQNAQLFQETKAALKETETLAHEQQVLADLGRALATRLDVTQVLEQAYQGISQLLDTPNFYVGLYDAEREKVRIAFHVSDSKVDKDIVVVGVDQGLAGYIIRNRTSVLVQEDMVEKLNELGVELVGAPAKAWLGVPMVVGDQVLGMMAAQSYDTPFIWDEHDQGLMQSIASQVAIALHNTYLFEETETALQEAETLAREQSVLNQLGQALTASLNVDQVLEEAYRQASRLVDTTNFYIGLYDKEKHEIHFALDVTESEIDSDISVISADEDLAGYIVHNRQSILLEDNVHQRQQALGIKMVGQESLSWLGVPLIVGDRVLGAMACHTFTTPGLYDEHDQELLISIGSQVAIALQNARLFEEIQNRVREMQLMQRVSEAAAGEVRIDQTLQAAAEAIATGFNTDTLALMLHDQEFNTLNLDAGVGYPPGMVGQERFPVGVGISGIVFQSGEPALILDMAADPRIIHFEGAEIPSGSELCVPIFLGQEAIGVINLETSQTNAFTEDDMQLLTAMASNVAIYVQRARLFEEARVRASELAILNELGQSLSGAFDMDQVCDSIYRFASRLLGVTDLYIALYQAETDTVSFPLAVGKGQALSWPPRQAGEGMTEYVINTRQPLLLKQDVTDEQASLGIQQIGSESQAWLGAPMLVGDQAIGMIAAQSFDPTLALTERHQDLLTAIASQAAITIQGVRLFEQTQARARHEQTLREVTTRVTRTPDVDTVMRAAVQEIGRVLGRQAFIYLGDQDKPDGSGNGKET